MSSKSTFALIECFPPLANQLTDAILELLVSMEIISSSIKYFSSKKDTVTFVTLTSPIFSMLALIFIIFPWSGLSLEKEIFDIYNSGIVFKIIVKFFVSFIFIIV